MLLLDPGNKKPLGVREVARTPEANARQVTTTISLSKRLSEGFMVGAILPARP